MPAVLCREPSRNTVRLICVTYAASQAFVALSEGLHFAFMFFQGYIAEEMPCDRANAQGAAHDPAVG